MLLFDSNIILHYLRDTSTKNYIEANYQPFGSETETLLSVVSIGELRALALKNNWGRQRTRLLQQFCSEFIVLDINSEDVLDKYAEIDAYSQNRLPGLSNPYSARNMGKNDLWIAATAAVTGADLITTDKDFDHLYNIFFNVIRIDI